MNFRFRILNILNSLLKAERMCCDIEVVVIYYWALKVISAQKVLFLTLFIIGFECFLGTNHCN